MTLFFRYIFRQAASALLLILVSLGGIVWIALALKELNVVTSQGQDGLMLLKLTTLALPNLLAMIAPFGLLIASVHVLNRLNSDSELIVMTASGATAWIAAKPLLLLALLVSGAIVFVNHVAMPWSLRTLRESIVEIRTDLLTQVMQPGKFSSPEKGLTFHIRDRTFEGDLLGLMVDDKREENEARAYLADRGRIVKQDGTAYIIMTDGQIIRRSAGGDEPTQILEFERYIVDIDQFDTQTVGGPSFYKPRERYTSELISPDPDDPYFKRRPGHYTAELHERFSNPLYPIAFVLIALAAIGQAQSTRQNRTERMGTAFVAGVGCRMAGLAVNNLVTVNSLFVPLMYAIPLLAIVLAMVSIRLNAYPRGGLWRRDRLGIWLEDRFAGLIARLRRRTTATRGHEIPSAGTPPPPTQGPEAARMATGLGGPAQ